METLFSLFSSDSPFTLEFVHEQPNDKERRASVDGRVTNAGAARARGASQGIGRGKVQSPRVPHGIRRSIRPRCTRCGRRDGIRALGQSPIADASSLIEESLDRLRAPLAALMRWFGAAGLRATIVGGVAASLRGKPRLTKDIDVVVLDAPVDELLRSAHPFGFTPRIDDAADFARRSHVLLLRYMPGNIDIDVSLGAPPSKRRSSNDRPRWTSADCPFASPRRKIS